MSEEGGTKLQRRRVSAPQQMPPEQMYQQQQQQQPRQYPPQMQMQAPPPPPPPQQRYVQPSDSSGFCFSFENKNLKSSLLVIIIFLILNSKMIWKEIIRIPFMGSTEPSIIALIVNAMIAGIVYYLISSYFIN